MADKTPEELNHSRLLDVHRWSDWPEVNAFVDMIYETHFAKRTNIRKKHVKVLLLDLYVAWHEDPDLCIAVHMRSERYKPKSRYNELHISRTMVEVVRELHTAGLIHLHRGFFDRSSGIGRTTRIWPASQLLRAFQDASIGVLDIGYQEGRETIILRDSDGNDIEYEDTKQTLRMRETLTAYNELLQATHIDCQHLDQPWVEKKQGRAPVSQHHKFVRRIFSRSSWEQNGRFYGGFWQSLPKADRGRIAINGKRTLELDFSGFHVALLYRMRGINYYSTIGGDPYDIEIPEVSDPEFRRQLIKRTMLICLNAEDEKSACRAICVDPSILASKPSGLELTNILLMGVINKLKAKHDAIAPQFCSDAGIELMHLDSKITEELIAQYTADGIPLLSVHDSYIIQEVYGDDLHERMQNAMRAVAPVPDDVDELFELPNHTRIIQHGYFDEELGVDDKKHAEMLHMKGQEYVSEAYLKRLGDFRRWMDSKTYQ